MTTLHCLEERATTSYFSKTLNIPFEVAISKRDPANIALAVRTKLKDVVLGL